MTVQIPEPSKLQPVVHGWRRAIYLFVAGIFFVLGGLGAILPGLPATPFLLLTSYLLVRASPRLNAWLLQSRFFGPILIDWQVHGGVRPDVKVKSILVVVGFVLLSSWLMGYSWSLIGGIWLAAAVGISVILRLPTARIPTVESPENQTLDTFGDQ